MAEVNDYKTGKILDDIKQAFSIFEFIGSKLGSTRVGERMLEEVKKFDPRIIDMESASQFIQESEKCAAGERVCRALHKHTPLTESIFLDELAEGMVEVGKAKYVTQKEATEILRKYRRNTLVVSKVSGKYMELCRTWPDKCVYWNMQKRGLRCLGKMDQTG